MTLDQFFIAINLVGATAAVVVNVWDAVRGWPDYRPLRTLIAALAVAYVIAYAVLLSGAVDRAEWSRFVVGLGPVAWGLVWCGPPVVSRWVARKVRIGTARALPIADPTDAANHPSRRHLRR